MYNDLPPLLDRQDGIMQYDPVTGAPISNRQGRPTYYEGPYNPALAYGAPPHHPQSPGFAPPYGYGYQGYINSPYLTPNVTPGGLPPSSPVAVPSGWVNAYYDYYGGGGSPYQSRIMNVPNVSPRRRATILPSPRTSPYQNLISLPTLHDEEYTDVRETWASRLRNWISGESRSDPHRQLIREVLVHECLDKRRSGIRWNVIYPPHTAALYEAPDPNESAFQPELAYCRIISPLMPWAIEVKAHEPYSYITILSLLGDIHAALKKPINRSIYENLPPAFREQVDSTYETRYMSMPDRHSSDRARDQGIKRVDFLLDRSIFEGLVQDRNLMDTFELKLRSINRI